MIGWALLALAGCRCGEAPVVAPPPVASGHFAEVDSLVRAAVRGDLEGAQWIAATMAKGNVPEPDDDGGGAGSVGAALGFLQMAEDGEEVVAGVAAMATGCGKCHAAARVARPGLQPWTHEGAGLRLVMTAAFPPIEAPPDGPEPLDRVRAAWDEAVDAEDTDAGDPDTRRLAAALAACAACHRAEG